MNIGSLNKIISIEAPTKASDGMGGFDTVWKEMAADVAAAIWPTSATEQIKSMGAVMTISHRIRIRYRSDLRASWRIKFKNRYFDIVSIVNPNMDNRILDIMAKEAAK